MSFKDKFIYFVKNNIFLVILLIIMVVRHAMEGSVIDWIFSILLSLPGIIIAITFHEAAHAFVSTKFGDPTPRAQGRLSLNPMAHIDSWGFLCLLFCGFGWGKPVEISPIYYKKRRVSEICVALAGVTTNFILAIIFGFLLKGLAEVSISGFFWNMLLNIVNYAIVINIILMIFNLLPIPPLDGWNVITQIFKLDKYEWWYKVMNYGYTILLILIVLGVTDYVVAPLATKIYAFILGI